MGLAVFFPVILGARERWIKFQIDGLVGKAYYVAKGAFSPFIYGDKKNKGVAKRRRYFEVIICVCCEKIWKRNSLVERE